jgi:NADH-quinone oxidoreductase subunit F
MTKVLRRIEHGHGRMDDMPLMQNVGDKILFKAFCALADGAISPIHSSLKFFMDEYEEHVRLGRCPFEDRAPVGAATAREAGAEATEGTETAAGAATPSGPAPDVLPDLPEEHEIVVPLSEVLE